MKLLLTPSSGWMYECPVWGNIFLFYLLDGPLHDMEAADIKIEPRYDAKTGKKLVDK